MTTANGAHPQQQLPVKATIEGPAACFRLLDVDESLGMTHTEFVGLLYSATDNRLVFWIHHQQDKTALS